MIDPNPEPSPSTPGLVYLQALAREFPNRAAVLAALATRRATLTLPKGTVHVVSDVHGEAEKLKHIINNGSGGLRPLIEELFRGRLAETEIAELLNFIYYPRESWTARKEHSDDATAQRDFVRRLVRQEFEVLRTIARRYDFASIERLIPDSYEAVFKEWIFAPELGRSDAFLDATIEPFIEGNASVELLRWIAHAIRNFFVSELIVAGDFGDRGPRIDGVIDFVMHQPNVAITWGNHDASWMGACLGQPACIATVLRMSVRYGRLAQLEQGYGIPLAPLEELATTVYANDPAEHFACSGQEPRDAALLRRMQKAIAMIQFKLEAQTIARNPAFNLAHRDLLPAINPVTGSVTIDGQSYVLRDTALPTVDWNAPNELSAEEDRCLQRLSESFLQSSILWDQMSYLARHGAMWLHRDGTLIFHGCVPVDRDGCFLAFDVLGKKCSGVELFAALEVAVQKAFRDKDPRCLDLLWYLWAGPFSPVFGKDKIATFENYFVADKAAQAEKKNAYFQLINDRQFCQRILREFGVAEDGLIVNGHVPVKIEEGESPLKKSGLAVTIDGAFSEVYGDHGYTLVLEAGRTTLAQHHHFKSVSDAIAHGTDIIPTVQTLREFPTLRAVADTEQGAALREEIRALSELQAAYESGWIEGSR